MIDALDVAFTWLGAVGVILCAVVGTVLLMALALDQIGQRAARKRAAYPRLPNLKVLRSRAKR